MDKLRDAGFIKSHIFLNDVHTIQFTERGMKLVQAIRDLEAALPKLSDGQRSGLWHLCRLLELPDSGAAQLGHRPGWNPENLDHAAVTLQLAESVASVP